MFRRQRAYCASYTSCSLEEPAAVKETSRVVRAITIESIWEAVLRALLWLSHAPTAMTKSRPIVIDSFSVDEPRSLLYCRSQRFGKACGRVGSEE